MQLLGSFWFWLAVMWLVLLAAEQRWPARRLSRSVSSVASDLGNVVCFVVVSGVAGYLVARGVSEARVFFVSHGFGWWPAQWQPLRGQPFWLQLVVVVVVADLFDYVIHVLLHRVPWLWRFHRVHHGIREDGMWFLASSRFHAVELAFYFATKAVPFLFLGTPPLVGFVHGVVVAFCGHLAHANLPFAFGPLRFALNTPAMHAWHHSRALPDDRTWNYGHCLSIWDWLFRTAHLPSSPPAAMGHDGDDELVDNVVGHQLWPLVRAQRSLQQRKPVE